MTVIAWDGRTLAADKQSTSGGQRRTSTKIYRVGDGLVALMGDAGHAHALLAWFRGARNPKDFPRVAGDEAGHILFFSLDGIFVYAGDGYGHPEQIEDKFAAFGSGRDYALAAMYLGHTARKAVNVACVFDMSCGMGIDTLELE